MQNWFHTIKCTESLTNLKWYSILRSASLHLESWINTAPIQVFGLFSLDPRLPISPNQTGDCECVCFPPQSRINLFLDPETVLHYKRESMHPLMNSFFGSLSPFSIWYTSSAFEGKNKNIFEREMKNSAFSLMRTITVYCALDIRNFYTLNVHSVSSC